MKYTADSASLPNGGARSVSSEQRFTAGHPCPICGGDKDLPHGVGLRCYGFLSKDGAYAYCTREEYAGNLEQNERSGTFAHRLTEPCDCGATHEPVHQAGQLHGVRHSGLESRFRLYDADGALVGVHVRIDYQREDGEWEKDYYWTQHGERGAANMPLYNLSALLAAPADARVYVIEGESACEALALRNVLAVGTVTGAHAIPCDESLGPLVGHEVALWPDNDEPGRRHMERIAERLAELGVKVRWLTWPDAPEHGDAADYCYLKDGNVRGLEALTHGR